MTDSNPSDKNSDEPPSTSFASLNGKISLKKPEDQTGPFSVQEPVFLVTEVVSDIEECHSLFEQFSLKANLFDTWEFRYAFYRAYKFKPYFLLLKNNFGNLALLPLWYDEDKKRYTWFGSDWQEEISFFARNLNLVPTLLSAAPSPLFLNAISRRPVEPLMASINFTEDLPKYILNLENFGSHEDFLMTLKKNRRHDLRKDRRRIERQNPEIVINNFDDIDQLVSLSKERFKDKGKKTDWEDPRRIQAFKEVINLGGRSYETRMITINIKGVTAGVDLICLYQDTYFAVKCGYNVKNFSGIGNFMNVIEIDDAIKLGMKKIDFLQNNYEWKERWFEQVPLVQYKK
ncbi:MAG: GNAT family N-acetyltransferase [bacterium]|nr:GNAT family N-acetyltransferase [bacterium]